MSYQNIFCGDVQEANSVRHEQAITFFFLKAFTVKHLKVNIEI